jgi:RES domain-containing protein
LAAVSKLPARNRSAACRKIGDQWLDDGESLVLKAPSVIVPAEHNIMLNPFHRAMRYVRIVEKTVFTFDARLVRA